MRESGGARRRTRVMGVPGWVMSRRFKVLSDHPGETEAFRSRFRNAVGLLFAYRAVGTTAALVAFLGSSAHHATGRPAITVLAVCYIGWAVVLCHQTSTVKLRLGRHRATIGRGRGEPLDSPIALGIDLGLAASANLLLAGLLPAGSAFTQFTDLFAVASITTVALWTGRRGGTVGALIAALMCLVELVKAPINGIRPGDVDGAVLATRWAWISCGWLVALGTVRILLDYADWTQALRIEDERLRAISHSHDDYRSALVAISGLAGQSTGAFAEAQERARLALATTEEPHYPEGTVAAVVAHAIASGQANAPAHFAFLAVDGARTPIFLTAPENLDRSLVNLCVNAARHSQGTRVTIRWEVDDGSLKLTVHDDGVGVPPGADGGGFAIVKRNLTQVGGTAELDVGRRTGTKWRIRLPSGAFSMSAVTL